MRLYKWIAETVLWTDKPCLDLVEIHEYPRPEGTRRMEEGVKYNIYK